MNNLNELCCYYIALLRCVGIIHQQHHWVYRANFADHLLFERIYGSSVKDLDLMAEKMVGLFGTGSIDLNLQTQIMSKILNEFSSGEPLEQSLLIEKKFLKFSEDFYKKVKEEDKMTLGLDDAILSVCSSREEAVYLLQQVLEEKPEEFSSGKIEARKRLLSRVVQGKTF